MTYTIESTITLNNDVEMPRFGLGTYQTPAGSETENAVRTALETGYRAVDTAAMYGNETAVGEAVHAGIVPREAVFITSKAWTDSMSYEGAKEAIAASRQRMKLDAIDLYLIHWPAGDWQGAWRAFEEAYRAGHLKAIGVSNFLQHHLEELLSLAEVQPMVNQFELHPFLQQKDLQDYCHEQGIQVTAWAPLMKGRVLEVPELIEIGKKYDKNGIHVTLRWMLQTDIITIPKSARREHIISNAKIFNFELSDEEIQVINDLDRDERIGTHPDHFA